MSHVPFPLVVSDLLFLIDGDYEITAIIQEGLFYECTILAHKHPHCVGDSILLSLDTILCGGRKV